MAPPVACRATLALTALLVPLLWFLNVTWSAAIWGAVPLITFLQFPWRLWGAFSLALACTGAGIYAWLARRGQQQWVLASVLVCFVAVNALGLHPWVTRLAGSLSLPPWPAQLRNLEGNQLAAGTTSGGEFLPRSVVLEEPLDTRRGGAAAYETPFPSGGWVAGRVWPYSGQVHVQQVWETPTWTDARVDVVGQEAAELAFRTLVFPGWRAYIDGYPVLLRPAPFDPTSHIGHGFAIVAVPPGTHHVQLAFGSTGWRTLGGLVSTIALGVFAGSLVEGVWTAGRARQMRAARRLTAAIALAALCAAAVQVAAAAQPLWRAPHVPGPAQAAIVLDLAHAVSAGQGVQILSPDGNALGRFVDVRDLTIGGHSRQWLYMHPPAEARAEITLPKRAVFQAGLAIEPGAWDEPGGGVRFVVEAWDGQGGRHRLLDEAVHPQARPTDRGWRFAEVDLGAFAGQHVSLVLRTEALETPSFAWSGWGTPTVYVDRSARYPPPARVAPALPSRPVP